MGRNISYSTQVAQLILRIKKSSPNITLGKHLITALSDCGELEWITDKEMYEALLSYTDRLELGDYPLSAILGEEETERLLREGEHLEELFLPVKTDEEEEF